MKAEENKPSRKPVRERVENLHREGWKIEFGANVFTNDERDVVAVVFLDGRFFRGTIVDEPINEPRILTEPEQSRAARMRHGIKGI